MSTDFKYLSISELFKLCQERNIKTAKSYTKEQLIDLLDGKELTKKIRYNYEYLLNFSKENNIELISYDEQKINIKSIITGKCKQEKCHEIFEKNFRSLVIQGGPYCKKCTITLKKEKTKQTNLEKYGVSCSVHNKDIKEKIKKQNLEKYGVEYIIQSKEVKEKLKKSNLDKYGVEHYFQSEKVKEKIKQTNLEKYGFENANKSEIVKEKIKQTNLEKYGKEYYLQTEDKKEKSKQTCLEKYGVEYNSQSEEVKEKTKQTCLEKYGVEYPTQSEEVKNNFKQTCLEKYGVENPMHNDVIAYKTFKNRFKRKPFTFPSGKIVKVQGYEPFCLRDLIEQKIVEEDIITDIKQIPEVWWEDDEKKKHRYYTDIYIKSQNKCIEVKSDYTFEKEKEEVLCKQQAVKNIGIDCEVWIYSKKGKLIEKLF